MSSNAPIAVIAGDSWATGERLRNRVTHGGLAEYLAHDGLEVVNLGVAGSSNLETLENLNRGLLALCKNHALDRVAYIFIFYTSWHRDFAIKPRGIWDLAQESNFPQNWFTPANFDTGFIGRYQYRIFEQFSFLAQSINKTFSIIGGCCEPEPFTSADHPNLVLACPSVTNLCINNDPFTANPVSTVGFSHIMLQTLRSDLTLARTELRYLLDVMEQDTARINLWRSTPEWFWPDGIHANRAAHFRLKNFLFA